MCCLAEPPWVEDELDQLILGGDLLDEGLGFEHALVAVEHLDADVQVRVDPDDDLLNGLPVDESRLDPLGLAWAMQMRFVRLDFHAITEWFTLLEAA